MRKGVRVEGRVLLSLFAFCCFSPQLPSGHAPCIFPCVCLLVGLLILTQDILSHVFLPFCFPAHTACLTVPPFHPSSDYSSPIGESWWWWAAPVPNDQDFGVLQFMLQSISHCMAASNSRQYSLLFCVPDVFTSVQALWDSKLQVHVEGGLVGLLAPLSHLDHRSKGWLHYTDQKRFPKCLLAPFEQSAHNCSCCPGGNPSKSWVQDEVWCIPVLGQLPVFSLGQSSCVNAPLIFSGLMWEMLSPR